MKRLLFVFLFASSLCCYGQKGCEAIIDWQYVDTVNVYDKPKGVTIAKMNNDTAKEDFLFLTISDETKTYFKVSIRYAEANEVHDGWVKKASYIGAYSRQYERNDLTLHEKPNTSSPEVTVKDWDHEPLLTFLTCQGEWILVKVKYRGRTYHGWIASYDLCPNPYTTCN